RSTAHPPPARTPWPAPGGRPPCSSSEPTHKSTRRGAPLLSTTPSPALRQDSARPSRRRGLLGFLSRLVPSRTPAGNLPTPRRLSAWAAYGTLLALYLLVFGQSLAGQVMMMLSQGDAAVTRSEERRVGNELRHGVAA